jgi:hypothetical protein
MWWNQPLIRGFPFLLPNNVLDVVARTYAVVEVGGLSGCGPKRGRNFETLFYEICDRRGVKLSERAGSRTLAEQRSASGLGHEVDGATRAVNRVTHWELKHLTVPLPKNDLLCFNQKGMDFLYGSSAFFAQVPLFRFLVSGSNLRQEFRCFSALWSIMVIEPGRFPLPLIYEAVARGAADKLSEAGRDALRFQLHWACRSLQLVLQDLVNWSDGTAKPTRCGPKANQHAVEVIKIQEEMGEEVLHWLGELFPDWIDELAETTWSEVGGW